VFERSAAVVSSHNGSAERQFRFPLEYGSQRPPTAQWTVTGAAAFLVGATIPQSESVDIGKNNEFPRITAALPGKIIDMGIKDANNMGAAMAPAAADTILAYFRESGEDPRSFDMILTGDLGFEGNAICRELLADEGLILGGNFSDCGILIFDPEVQDTHSGGSGCGCSATVLGGYIYRRLINGEIGRALIIGTGALMSPAMIQQGKSIAGIGHLIKIENG
ncbi:MAG: stage V sporulation protein AD, partial [Clostridia bacterium]|nr:stage V sporulation protein AD [Clostridia bacterium]